MVDAPLRLQRFVPGEWRSVSEWIEARRMWSAVHGDVLGNPLERLRVERETRRAWCEASHSGIDSLI
ncbi:hypothetical protein SAMN05660359_04477 [Geodermatophilus obscurus]|uniref:Uncharacterized protein n=1 Tax=Geodermatophilus obscurus TaxID=1861 RepID=A0A1I5IC00_9ACTN|nr:hypothetical protein SAMN05660359_04477 [Geodermatophilus obscurus]